MFKTLQSFPEDFKPLMIVTGDRREVPPQSKGDLLAYSVSSTDVMYMSQLNFLPDEDFPDHGVVVSDKQFVEESEDVLQQRFGYSNLLVIGSPAVNLLARRINDQCLFRFAISDNTKLELEEQNDFIDDYIVDHYDRFIYHQCLEGIFDTKIILKRYTILFPDIDKIKNKINIIVPKFKTTKIFKKNIKTHSRPIRYLMHKLDIPGIYDFSSDMIRGKSLRPNSDYGLITITQNPFSDTDEYRLIYVAGVHGPGTALGLRKLNNKRAFTMHPLGGVFEVRIKKHAVYFERIMLSDEMWETPAYKLDDVKCNMPVLENIKVFLSSPAKKSDYKQKKFNHELKSLIQDICINKNIHLEIEGPYTLPFGRRLSFWQTVLDFEKGCEFVIHDMTDFARGVMIELGFSIGVKKQFFLIWNNKKKKVDNHLPNILPVSHIEEINIDNKSETRNILRKKIIGPALEKKSIFDCHNCTHLNETNHNKTAFVYCLEPALEECIDEDLSSRKINRIFPEDSNKELPICKICDVLKKSDYIIIQLKENDPNGFIILGMSKAFKLKPSIMTLDKFGQRDFAWAEEVKQLNIRNLSKQLKKPMSIYLNS